MDTGDTAWVLASCALVLFMTPGLAFFYGGMVRSKNVLAMLMQNFFAMGLISVLWVLVGFSLAFGNPAAASSATSASPAWPTSANADFGFAAPLTIPAAGVLRLPDDVRHHHPGADHRGHRRPAEVRRLGRLPRRSGCILVYSPVAHWVFSPDGWLFKLGALDFAGGTVVHINAGIAALALVLVIGKRKGWPKEAMPPHALPWTLLGTGILWFGWFGFNAGSALGANGIAAQAFMNTNIAAAAAMLGWLVVEKLKGGHATTLGGASGAVAGLVAITPCAGFVNPMAAVVIGFVAGVRLLPRPASSSSSSASTTRST